ncbi:MAG: methyltransferase domain-containing protein [Patescibacteria group bacterium]|nr:methyltransferase domain-containing protein [Patescibacteria group bacterium]
MVWLYFTQRTALFDGRPKRMLHFAPERPIMRRIAAHRYIDYCSADLSSPAAQTHMDISALTFPDQAFDVILCCHVLEHVPNDRKAMSELYRVLKPGGWALLQVPIRGDTTLENPCATTAEERRRLFGQEDHVRQYGRDFDTRLATAGFVVTVDDFVGHFDEDRRTELGLVAGDDIYLCRRSDTARA